MPSLAITDSVVYNPTAGLGSNVDCFQSGIFKRKFGPYPTMKTPSLKTAWLDGLESAKVRIRYGQYFRKTGPSNDLHSRDRKGEPLPRIFWVQYIQLSWVIIKFPMALLQGDSRSPELSNKVKKTQPKITSGFFASL
jgi:hypothetical protein